jgi:putative oxidoreductase
MGNAIYGYDAALLIGRLLLGGCMLIMGLQNTQLIAEHTAWYGRLGIPFHQLLAPFSIAFEIVAGLLIISGFLTRPAVLLVGGFMALDALVVHGGLRTADDQYKFILDMAVVGGCLAFYAAGAGCYSIDARR